MFSSSHFESRTKKYIIVFSELSIIMTVFSALVMSIKIGLLHGIISGIVISIAWTIFMALIFVPIDYWATRKLPVDALNVNQTRDIKLSGELKTIYDYCIDVIKNIKGINRIENKDNINIVAVTRTSLSSFGEMISLKLIKLDNETVSIHIMSHPIYKYTMLDYGNNYKNVEYIVNQISKYKS